MSRTCGTTGKSKHPFLRIRNEDGEIICLSILFAFSEASVRFTTRNYHNLYIKVLFCRENDHFVNSELPFSSRCDTIQAWSESPLRDVNGGKEMKYCQQCGSQLVDQAVVCPNCGCTVQEPINQQEDKPSTGLNVLAFLFPLIGLIMYLSFKKTMPVRAKALEKWTLIGFIVGLVISAVSRAL